jgi:hypothetical protein
MLLVMVVALLAIAPSARAATFTVYGTEDSVGAACEGVECESLRAAVTAAALSAGPDAIRLGDGVFQLEQGQLVVGSDVTILGAGARQTTIRGNPNLFRVLEVPVGPTVSISGATLRDGRAAGTAQNPGFQAGGVIRNSGTLNLDRVRVTGGLATSGGGIANTSGTLVVDRSLIDNNAATIDGADSGGLLNFGGGDVTLRNTTIAFNQASPGKAGAYSSWSDDDVINRAVFEHVTIAFNSSGVDHRAIDELRVKASVFASNGASNCARAPQNAGFTVESGTGCGFTQQNEQAAVSDALENLGGDTDVLRLLAESGANNLVPAAECGPTDQRGVARATATACDAGAVEVAVAPPVITDPEQDAWVGRGPLTISGSGVAAGATILVYEGTAEPIAGAQADANGAWTATVDFLPEGLHTLTLVAEFAGVQSVPVTLRVVSDRTEPEPTIESRPPAVTNRSEVTFTYSANEPAEFECQLFTDGTGQGSETCPAAGKTYSGLEDGEYEFRLYAIDRAGNSNEGAARWEFRVERGLIAAPQVSEPATEPAAATLTFSTDQAERTLTCRLEGPGREPAFGPCTSPQRYENLPAGGYRFTVRSTDELGNFADSPAREFTIAGPPVVVPEQIPPSTPAPTPTPTVAATPTPQPEGGKTVVTRPTGGKVLIRLPGSTQFTELKSIDDIPLGATIDVRSGRVQVRFESEPGKVQVAVFYGGMFKVTQVGRILDLRLNEPLAACPKKKGKASAAQTKKATKAKKRKLWGNGKGSFRTSGKHSAATVRGTQWLVEDSCAGTLTRVTSGVVAVKHRKKTILVRAGKRYLAKPR